MLSVRVERVPGSHGTNPFSYPLEASAIHQVVRLDIFGSPARSKESLWQKGQETESQSLVRAREGLSREQWRRCLQAGRLQALFSIF